MQASEQAVAAAARADLAGADARWRALGDAALALDYAARMQARQLVADTFERITVWLHGVRPSDTPAGSVDVLLQAKGGRSRLLRIDAHGHWVAAEDIQLSA